MTSIKTYGIFVFVLVLFVGWFMLLRPDNDSLAPLLRVGVLPIKMCKAVLYHKRERSVFQRARVALTLMAEGLKLGSAALVLNARKASA